MSRSSAADGRGGRPLGRRIAPVLLFCGVAVLGYAGLQYGAMVLEQRHLRGVWERQQGARAMRTASAERESGLTRISIPSIGFSAVLVEGTDPLTLLLGPGHMTGTATPGEAGNAVVSAHRDTFFRNIAKVSAGDRIVVERDGRSYTYAVEGLRIVRASDVSVAAATRDNRLTLITCDPEYYLGPAPQRLVVISKLVTTTKGQALKETAKQRQAPGRVKQAAVRKPGARAGEE